MFQTSGWDSDMRPCGRNSKCESLAIGQLFFRQRVRMVINMSYCRIERYTSSQTSAGAAESAFRSMRLALPGAGAPFQASRPHSPTTSMQTNPTSVPHTPSPPPLPPPATSKLPASDLYPAASPLPLADGLHPPALVRASTIATPTTTASRHHPDAGGDYHISGSEPRVWPGVISRRRASASEQGGDGTVKGTAGSSYQGSVTGGG
jgi:AMP deaminase